MSREDAGVLPCRTRPVAKSLHAHASEERVTEHAVGPRGPVQRANAGIEAACCRESRGYSPSSDPFDHRRERLPGEPVDQIGTTRIDVHHPCADSDIAEARADEQWVQLPADERVAAGLRLQEDLATNGRTCSGTVRVKVCGAVIALDYRDRPSPLQQSPKHGQHASRVAQMLEHETHEHVIEGLFVKRRGADVDLPELHVRDTSRLDGTPRRRERGLRLVDGDETGVRTSLRQDDSLNANTAPDLEDDVACGIRRVAVNDVDERVALVAKTLVLGSAIAMYVLVLHPTYCDRRRGCAS